jgi:hypothetical protein
MKRKKHNWKRQKVRKPGTKQPQRLNSINVRVNGTKRRPQFSLVLRKVAKTVRNISLRIWGIIAILAVALGLLLDVDDYISRWGRSKPPTAEIMYFVKEGSNYILIEPANVTLKPTRREFEKNYLAVPINLAVHNQEKARLEATRVEITYPKDLRVIPEGRPKIDPANNTLIYEHDLRSLDPVTSFTPLDTIDVIHLKYSIIGARSRVVLRKNLVDLEVTVGLESTDHPKGIDLGVKVFSRGRPPLQSKLHLSVDPSKAYGYGDSNAHYKPIPLDAGDVALFRTVSRRLEVANRVWEVQIKGKSTTFALAKTRNGSGSYSGLLLGGKVTELFVDQDGDGMLDYHLVDSTDPGSPDQKLQPSRPEPVTDMLRPDDVQLA